jgi:hypothetical protein
VSDEREVGITDADRQTLGEMAQRIDGHGTCPSLPGVSAAECTDWCERYVDGESPSEIAATSSFTRRTVYYHVKSQCLHPTDSSGGGSS